MALVLLVPLSKEFKENCQERERERDRKREGGMKYREDMLNRRIFQKEEEIETPANTKRRGKPKSQSIPQQRRGKKRKRQEVEKKLALRKLRKEGNKKQLAKKE